MKMILRILIRIWIVIACILVGVILMASTIGMLWLPYWFLSGRNMPDDVIRLASFIPDLPKKEGK